ncbi:Xylose isomerase [compost metagenome]
MNFDAKVRRGSFEPEDLFYAHIAGMDAYAKGLKVAAKMIEDRVFENVIEERYATFKEGIGQEIVSGKATLQSLEAYALQNNPVNNKSGRLELIRSVFNQYILGDL